MIITSINRKKGTRYEVCIDEEPFMLLDAETIMTYDLQPGKEIDEADLDEIRRTAERKRARERAYYLLSLRDYSMGELCDKLSETVSEDIAIETTRKMRELGLMDDRRFAEHYIETLRVSKKFGSYRIRQECRKKHLSDELVSEILMEQTEEAEDPLQPLRELVEKKYSRKLQEENGKRKVIAALIRLGHSYSDIREVLGTLEEEYWED